MTKEQKLIVAYLTHNGFEVWKKAGEGKERIYINNQGLYELGLDKELKDQFKGVTMYYEINKDRFYFKDVLSDHIDTLEALTQEIRETAMEVREG